MSFAHKKAPNSGPPAHLLVGQLDPFGVLLPYKSSVEASVGGLYTIPHDCVAIVTSRRARRARRDGRWWTNGRGGRQADETVRTVVYVEDRAKRGMRRRLCFGEGSGAPCTKPPFCPRERWACSARTRTAWSRRGVTRKEVGRSPTDWSSNDE